jgi:hypothetical protein
MFFYVSIFQPSYMICDVCIKRRAKRYNSTNVSNTQSSVNNSLSIPNNTDISASTTDISTQGSDSSSQNVEAMPPPAHNKPGPKSAKSKWVQENRPQNSPNIAESSTQDTEDLMHSFEATRNDLVLSPVKRKPGPKSAHLRMLQEVQKDLEGATQDTREPSFSSEDSYDRVVNRTPLFSQEQSQPANVNAQNQSSSEEPEINVVSKKRKLGPRLIDTQESLDLPRSQPNEGVDSDENSRIIENSSSFEQRVSFSQDTQQNQNVNQSIVQDLNDQDEPVNAVIYNAGSRSTRSRSRSSSSSSISTLAPMRVSSKFFLFYKV